MAATKLIAQSIMALTLAIAPAAVGSLGLNSSAYAKGGNGGGNGGDHGGGHGSDHGGGHGSDRGGSSSHGNSGNSRGGKETKDNKSGEKSHQKSHTSKGKEKTSKPAKAEKVVTSAPVVVDPVVEPEAQGPTPGLRSLNRNYHAYLNSSDPKMAGISAYAIAYAEFEAENGVDAIPTDPALSDEALREALAGFTKDGVVSDDMVDDAKEILGVGPAVGKIDEIRETLPPVDETDPDAEVAE
ncbi:hypothetical protein LAC79_32250 [Ensifer adhaerens]|uniref:hypothetical protein n=1 Tax=Ensifer adhaerens TaxID=106592 RepID=UPI001CBB853C|nr:hypothetical protein [Ensifer adhaerens]MBZ7926447.1 hypothetical protein [Ensifer adhaerens]UAX97201.1 hypothetical protein LAC78_26075 [Ensifer adhaerens]